MRPYRVHFPYSIHYPEIYAQESPWKLHVLVEKFLVLLAKLLSGVSARWIDNSPVPTPRVYIANHTSHLDFLLIWSSLPQKLRQKTIPVAGEDYWDKGPIRRYLVKHVFKTLTINRKHVTLKNNPLELLRRALQKRQSLILFPEGTRSRDGKMRDFKSGIYHLAKTMPHVEFVPVYVKNANRVLPKGESLPVPMLCSVTFGAPFRFDEQLDKHAFLTQARNAVEGLKLF